MKKVKAVAIALLCSAVAFTQTDSLQNLSTVVVTGNKYETNERQSGKTITKITAEQLAQHQGKTVAEILNTVAGVHVDAANNHNGNNTSFYLRGGRRGQVLVLIDGIAVNDASDIDNAYDLRFLNTNNIESIEVLKGGAGSLYGSDAVSGVVNIILKKTISNELNGNGGVRLSTFGDVNPYINISSGYEKFKFHVGLNYLTSESFSAAKDTFRAAIVDSSLVTPNKGDFEKDKIEELNAMVKMSYSIDENWDINLMIMIDRFESDIDNGEFADDENRVYQGTQQLYNLQPKYSYDNGSLKLNMTYHKIDRTDNNDTTEFVATAFKPSYTGGFLQSAFGSERYDSELQWKHDFASNITMVMGMGYEKLQSNSENTNYSFSTGGPTEQEYTRYSDNYTELFDPYVSFFASQNQLSVQAGVRANFHSKYGEHLTYSINPAINMPLNDNMDLKVYGNASTSFKAPSLYQLFNVSFGNSELEAEEAEEFEVGATLYYNDNLKVNVAYYNRNEVNKVGFDFSTFRYSNIDARSVTGVDVEANYQISKKFAMTYNYSTVNSTVETSLYRIPKVKYGFGVNIMPCEGLTTNLFYNYIGTRETPNFNTGGLTVMENYNLLNVSANYSKIYEDRVSVFLGINNLMDSDYVDVYGFTEKGRNATLGVNYKF